MKKLGLDLGASSLGWAIREDEKFVKKGVITFQSGMKKGQGGCYYSPTKDRRESRSKRRLIQARKYRKQELLKILLEEFVPLSKTELETWSKYKKGQDQKYPKNLNFQKWLACDFMYEESGKKYKNPYELRVKALDHKLSKHEFGRTLYHLVQRRGYKDIGETDKETEKQKQRRAQGGFQQALNENRTIAEALTKEYLEKGIRARNQYPYRDEYQDELESILIGQGYNISKNGKGEYHNEFVQKIWKAIIWQRPLRSQKGNIGKCSLEADTRRCPISHPVFEIFRAWSIINTIKYYNENNEKIDLPQKFRVQLFDQIFIKKDKNFKFEEIRIFLDKQFNKTLRYNYPFNPNKKIYDSTVPGMPVCKGLMNQFNKTKIREAIHTIENYNIGNAPKIINGYSIYDLWHILFEFDENHLKDFAINKLKIENERNKTGKDYNPFVKLKNNLLPGYSDLSLKAMCKIIPFLKEGFQFNGAVVMAKIPELLGEKWNLEKDRIKECLEKTIIAYNWIKNIIGITNSLIERYKGLEPHETYGFKDYQYILNVYDLKDIENACMGFFGEKTWRSISDKEKNIKRS